MIPDRNLYAAALLLPVIVAVLLTWPAVALADITGPARIIDGDTIDIAGERIRLHGIDAPEAAQTCVADGVTWPCGQSATAALVEFIGGAAVTMMVMAKLRSDHQQPRRIPLSPRPGPAAR